MRVSIVTVTWNSAATLRDTIESVLKQDYSDLEYIIADGLSTDGTVDIIKEYEPQFGGRMKWYSEKDQGMYDAMNKGIKMATGDVVGIINSDDFFHRTDVISKVAEAFTNDKSIEAVYGDFLKIFRIHFPMTSFRLKNMTTDNIINIDNTYKITPKPSIYS